MARLMRSIAGTMIVSINDHPQIREVFAGLPMREVDITYTLSGGDQAQAARELIIGNWRHEWPAPLPMTQTIGLELG